MMIVLFIYIVTSYGFDDYKKVWEYYLESTNWELLKDYKMVRIFASLRVPSNWKSDRANEKIC